MRIDETLLQRMNALVVEGERVVASGAVDYALGAYGAMFDMIDAPKVEPAKMLSKMMPTGEERVDEDAAFRWATSTLHVIELAFGQDSPHWRTINAMYGSVRTLSRARECLGVLRSARDDYAAGLAQPARQLVTAELFDDFLEQAQHLLDEQYKGPAAVVAGCVLEDTLRKLCVRNAVAPMPDSLNGMNDALGKVGVLDKLRRKQVTFLADLRNKAAHGEWDQFTDADVTQMIVGVRQFVTDHPVP